MPAKIGIGGFIRGMHEARSALAEVLALAERRLQIILIMQKIVICMSRDTRKFLSDAMAGLIEGGLDYMRQKRREAIQAMQKKAAPAVAAPVVAAPVVAPPQAAPPQKSMGSDAIRERIQREMNRKREDEQRRQEEAARAAREEAEAAAREQERLAREEEQLRLVEEARLRAEKAKAEADAAAVEVEAEVEVEREEIPDYELPSPEDFAAEPPPPPPAPEPIAEEAPPVVEAPPPPPPPPAPVLIFNSTVPASFDDVPTATENDELKAIEELGTELDALSLADVAREIFPDLKKDYEPWQIARTIFIDEASMRKAVLQGARLKDNERATMLAPALDDVKRHIEKHRPRWERSIPSIREVIDAHFAAEPPRPGRATPDQVQDVIVMSDQNAMDLLRLIVKSNEPGLPFVAKVRGRLDRLLDIEAERA